MKMENRVADHSADEIRNHIRKTNQVDRFAQWDETTVTPEELRSRFLKKYPDGLIFDFNDWLNAHGNDNPQSYISDSNSF